MLSTILRFCLFPCLRHWLLHLEDQHTVREPEVDVIENDDQEYYEHHIVIPQGGLAGGMAQTYTVLHDLKHKLGVLFNNAVLKDRVETTLLIHVIHNTMLYMGWSSRSRPT